MRSVASSGDDEEPLAISVRGDDRTNVRIDTKEDCVILLADGRSPSYLKRGKGSYGNNPFYPPYFKGEI